MYSTDLGLLHVQRLQGFFDRWQAPLVVFLEQSRANIHSQAHTQELKESQVYTK